MVLQRYYRSVTGVLQGSLKGFTRMLGCFIGVLQGSNMGVTKWFLKASPGCYTDISCNKSCSRVKWVSEGCYRGFAGGLQRC